MTAAKNMKISVPVVPGEEEKNVDLGILADNPLSPLDKDVIAKSIDGNYSTEAGQCYVSNLESKGMARVTFQTALVNIVGILNRAETRW